MKQLFLSFSSFLFLLFTFSLPAQPTYFKVRVENVGQAFPFSQSGAFTTPVGAAEPAPAFPAEAYEFSFYAAPGNRLSLATMFVQSNDLFYAPDEDGIALYDDGGNPITGDVTDQLQLWDSGTEMNEEPGLGVNQAPRQGGPNQGPADLDNLVRLVNDGYTYPAASNVIRLTLTHHGGMSFTARIENVSTAMTLQLSDGTTAPVPLSPGVFVIHNDPAPLFTVGEPDRGEGLEAIAEDGDPSALASALAMHTGVTTVLSPGAFVVHSDNDPLFTVGSPDRGEGLENIAEDGDPGSLAATLTASTTMTGGPFAVPVGGSGPAPILPGGAYEFVIASGPTGKLSLATMFVQSNDLFFAPDGNGVALFENGTPIEGDITDYMALWDAGTEENEFPGIGVNQAPRQSGPNTGPADSNNRVRLVDDGFGYPTIGNSIKVTVTPLPSTQFTVRIENVSTAATLSTGDNTSVPVPLSPGVWAVHSTAAPLFTVGASDRGLGLEAIAEDGDPSLLAMSLSTKMGTPSAAFNTPVGADAPAPAFPGEAYEFSFTAAPGAKLSLATMFVQSNDLFYAPDGGGIELFDASGNPITGDITDYFDLWDAGTELNEQPGVGANQAPRQSGPNVGDPDTDSTIRLINDGFTYPADEDVIRVTINPEPPVSNTARLQIIHNAQSLTARILVNGDVFVPEIAYRTATPYVDVPADTPLEITLETTNRFFNGAPITQTVTFSGGRTYVVAAHGTWDESDAYPLQLSVFEGALESVADDEVGIQLFHGSPDAPPVDVLTAGSVLFDDVAYTEFGVEYLAVPADRYILDITTADDNTNVVNSYEAGFGFWKGRTAVIFATEFLADGSFRPWVALSNGGTYPLSEVRPNNFRLNAGSVTLGSAYSVGLAPNPSDGQTQLNLDLSSEGEATVQVFHANGALVKTIELGRLVEGRHRVDLDLTDLAKGTYFVQTVTAMDRKTLPLVIN